MAGSQEFLNMISTKLNDRFTFGKTELAKFKFTGLNIEKTQEGIYVDQIQYIHSIQSISSHRMDSQDDVNLNKMEMKAYRSLTGQLNWAAESTRPDLAFDIRHLATRNKCAKISDIKKANKILKKPNMKTLG